jgi:hypothetical protein
MTWQAAEMRTKTWRRWSGDVKLADAFGLLHPARGAAA